MEQEVTLSETDERTASRMYGIAMTLVVHHLNEARKAAVQAKQHARNPDEAEAATALATWCKSGAEFGWCA